MPATRPRRIVRRAVMALAVVVMLLASYVSSWVLLPQLARRGWTDWTTVNTLEETVFAPITVYTVEEWPGAAWLNAAWSAVNGSALDNAVEM